MTDLHQYDNMTIEDAQDIYMYIEKKNILNGYTFPQKPSKDGYYRVYVSDSTKKAGRKQLTAKTLEELQDKVYAHEKGIRGACRKTFEDAWKLAMEKKLSRAKGDKLPSVQNTVGRYNDDYERFFQGTAFERKFIDCISKNDIEDVIEMNLKRFNLRKKAYSALLHVLRAAFNFARTEQWIKENPFSLIEPEDFDAMVLDDVPIEDRVHSDSELVQILDEIHRHQAKKPAYLPAYALELQIIIGARRGEIPPLRRKDVKDDYIWIVREQITVKKHDNVPEHCIIVNRTKNRKNRRFPLTVVYLNEFLERFFTVLDRYYPDSEYLFPANTETGVISNNTVYNYYGRVCKKLGIRICKEVIKGPHSFRRNAITDVVNSTGNLILASALFGNTPPVAKNNYFTGINDEAAVEALNKRKFS